MKIVYIDTNLAGHHIPYLQGLVGLADESVAVLPERIPHFAMRQRVCAFPKENCLTLTGGYEQ